MRLLQCDEQAEMHSDSRNNCPEKVEHSVRLKRVRDVFPGQHRLDDPWDALAPQIEPMLVRSIPRLQVDLGTSSKPAELGDHSQPMDRTKTPERDQHQLVTFTQFTQVMRVAMWGLGSLRSVEASSHNRKKEHRDIRFRRGKARIPQVPPISKAFPTHLIHNTHANPLKLHQNCCHMHSFPPFQAKTKPREATNARSTHLRTARTREWRSWP